MTQEQPATTFDTAREFALAMDEADGLRLMRDEFFIPKAPRGGESIYFTGNSLGLQPRNARSALEQELRDWAELGVEGHFQASNPWYRYHERLREPAARVVGAQPGEVVVMNTLTTNLHLMLVSFYRPTARRHRILIDAHTFPSDLYAIWSQVRYHGYDPAEAIVTIAPAEGTDTIDEGDIERLLVAQGESIALVLLGGVNYYSGQAYDMRRIAAAAHAHGCTVGFDLAHAAGNLVLSLHDWDVDFAVWCTYKYLNSGPGSVGGCFVHERYAFEPGMPRFAGWWGTEPQTRFEMGSEFVPQRGAAGWQLSNAQVLPMAVHRASLDLFDRIGMPALRAKSEALTGYLEFLIDDIASERLRIITPRSIARRGCQLSIHVDGDARRLTEALAYEGVFADYRRPDVVRLAPVPMYNSFEDVWEFARILRALTSSSAAGISKR